MQATGGAAARKETSEVDPALQPIVDYMSKRIELAFEKAVVHHTDSRKYPLPDNPKAIESVLARRLSLLPPERRGAAVSVMMPQVMSPSRESKYGPLAKVDLQAAVPLFQQARSIALPEVRLTAADLKRFAPGSRRVKTIRAAGHALASTPAEVNNLQLVIHRVKCVEDTSEAKKDEISIGGVMTNFATAATTEVPPLDMGRFKKGTVKKFSNPVKFQSFNLREGSQFPKSYLAVLAASEIDFGGFEDFLTKLLDGIADEINVIVGIIVSSISAGAAAGSIVPAVGTIAGLIAGAVFGILFAFLRKAFKDETFLPQTVTPVTIDSLTDRFPAGALESEKEVLVFLGFAGHYEVTVSWRLSV